VRDEVTLPSTFTINQLSYFMTNSGAHSFFEAEILRE
jgi:hypothetical protein